MDVLVRALIKSHVPGPRVGKSDGRLKKYHATASPILCKLCWHSKSFLFNALWRHTLQWRHIRFRLGRVQEKHAFYWCINFENFQSNMWTCKTFWMPLVHWQGSVGKLESRPVMRNSTLSHAASSSEFVVHRLHRYHSDHHLMRSPDSHGHPHHHLCHPGNDLYNYWKHLFKQTSRVKSQA